MSQDNKGFTAVELLITLFVAAAFLIAGYQLFNLVIRDGGETRAESRAGNIAYDYLRRYGDSATNPCTDQIPVNNQSISVSGLSDARMTVTISCPEADTTALSKVEAIITYNNPLKTVRHATYVDKSKGASAATDITNGLVAWWKLNGNATSSVGTSDGQVFGGATLTTGQNGQADSAYNFNGTGYINADIPNFGGDRVHTISMWVRPTSYGARNDPLTIGNAATNNSSSVTTYSSTTYWYFYNNDIYYAAALPTNVWSFLTLTYQGGGGTTTNKKMYVNGAQVATVTSGGNYGNALALPTTAPVGIGYDRGRNTAHFVGAIDDVRVYNRVLSGSEALQLYNWGAK